MYNSMMFTVKPLTVSMMFTVNPLTVLTAAKPKQVIYNLNYNILPFLNPGAFVFCRLLFSFFFLFFFFSFSFLFAHTIHTCIFVTFDKSVDKIDFNNVKGEKMRKSRKWRVGGDWENHEDACIMSEMFY